MRRAGNDHQFNRSAHPLHGLTIQLDDRFVVAADDESVGAWTLGLSQRTACPSGK
jgi:hypothetical protein